MHNENCKNIRTEKGVASRATSFFEGKRSDILIQKQSSNIEINFLNKNINSHRKAEDQYISNNRLAVENDLETLAFLVTEDDEKIILVYLAQILRDYGKILEAEYNMLITKG